MQRDAAALRAGTPRRGEPPTWPAGARRHPSDPSPGEHPRWMAQLRWRKTRRWLRSGDNNNSDSLVQDTAAASHRNVRKDKSRTSFLRIGRPRREPTRTFVSDLDRPFCHPLVVKVKSVTPCVTNAEGNPSCRQVSSLIRCCTRDEGLLALRSRPAGGGFKPPHAALAEDRRGER